MLSCRLKTDSFTIIIPPQSAKNNFIDVKIALQSLPFVAIFVSDRLSSVFKLFYLGVHLNCISDHRV